MNNFSIRPRDFSELSELSAFPGPCPGHKTACRTYFLASPALLATLQADLPVQDDFLATLQADLSVQDDFLAILRADLSVQADFLSTLQANLSVQDDILAT